MLFEKLIRGTIGLRYWLDALLYKADERTTSTLRELREEFQGRTVLVVGNGPSLNSTPLADFAGVPAIGMNKIDLLFSRTSWRPNMIVCVNNLVVKQSAEEFRESAIPVFLSWKCRWFMGRRRGRNVHYFLPKPTIEFSKNVHSWVAGRGGTVTYTAMQFAYSLGAARVILFGVDHSYASTGPAHKIVKSQGEDSSHFDPNYFGKNMYWGLPDLEESEQAYRLAKQVFDAAGREILDATVGGKLDVFKKISLAEARDLCV